MGDGGGVKLKLDADFCIANDTRPILDVNECWGVRGCDCLGNEVGNGREIRACVSPWPSTWAGARGASDAYNITDSRI